jgi:hypothetical protein
MKMKKEVLEMCLGVYLRFFTKYYAENSQARFMTPQQRTSLEERDMLYVEWRFWSSYLRHIRI